MTIVARPTSGKPCTERLMHSIPINVCVDLRMRGSKSRTGCAGTSRPPTRQARCDESVVETTNADATPQKSKEHALRYLHSCLLPCFISSHRFLTSIAFLPSRTPKHTFSLSLLLLHRYPLHLLRLPCPADPPCIRPKLIIPIQQRAQIFLAHRGPDR